MMWRSSPSSSWCSLTRPQVNFLISYLVLYLFAVLYCQRNFYRDPGSFFFDEVEGYRPIYSLERVERAKTFIKWVSGEQASSYRADGDDSRHNKNLCLGIATIKRPEEQYVHMTLGSLLVDLTPAEREEIYLTVLFGHQVGTEHPLFKEPWVHNVTDKILTYAELKYRPPNLVGAANKEHRIAKKTLKDYGFLLRTCLNETEAPWIAVVEDDVLAQEGWYRRTMRSLYRLQHMQKTTGSKDWLYLRLFYTEKFMGWNEEDWPRYLSWSLILMSLPALCGFYARRRLPSARNTLSPGFLAIISLLCVPMAIALFFLSGRMSMQPLRPGIRKMNEFACCSQALVFPREMVPGLIERLDKMLIAPDPVDSVIEEWADEKGLDRWALVPSAMQHIGKKTFKKDGDSHPRDQFEVAGARGLWSFGFELHDRPPESWWDNDFDLRATMDTTDTD